MSEKKAKEERKLSAPDEIKQLKVQNGQLVTQIQALSSMMASDRLVRQSHEFHIAILKEQVNRLQQAATPKKEDTAIRS